MLLNPDKIWISVDGGGTKTELCACNSSGVKIYDKTFGKANYKTADLNTVAGNLLQAYNAMLSDLQIRPDQIAGMVMGIAGCDSQKDINIYLDIMQCAGIPKEKLYICNDTEVVFRALSDEAGICAVAGTGSIVCGFDSNGMVARVGGWGSPLSDEGSGYWVGAEILRSMIRWLDGIDEEPSPIYDDIQRLFLSAGAELQWTLSALSVTQVASIAPIVFDYAAKNDKRCRSIMQSASEHMVSLIVTLCNSMKFSNKFSIVMVGGLFSNKNFYQNVKTSVQQSLQGRDFVFRKPVNSPAEDGLQFALKRYPCI